MVVSLKARVRTAAHCVYGITNRGLWSLGAGDEGESMSHLLRLSLRTVKREDGSIVSGIITLGAGDWKFLPKMPGRYIERMKSKLLPPKQPATQQ